MLDHYIRTSFQSTPSTQRETHINESDGGASDISIHSLYAEGDSSFILRLPSHSIFQSTPSTQRETLYIHDKCRSGQFQSTPSTQRETRYRYSTSSFLIYFNPLPLRRGRHHHCHLLPYLYYISIHSLYAEGDFNAGARIIRRMTFQSTPSTQRETTRT